MKTLTLALILLSLVFVSCQAQQADDQVTISTFNNRSVHYGWNGKDFSEPALHQFLSKNFHKTPKLELQDKLIKEGIKAELLWKISGPLNDVKKITEKTKSSWFWADAKPDSFRVIFWPDGVGVIHLFQAGTIVAQFDCHTSASRNAKKYNQLSPGNYSVKNKKKRHVATEPGLTGTVLKHALFAGVDGKWFHEGEDDASHGCVRVSEPAMIQFYSLISIGTPFTVEWM